MTKELVEEWFATAVATVIGLVLTGLWGFRERTHRERYSDVTTRLTAVESELDDLQTEHAVINERVNTIAERQEKIGCNVEKILDSVTRLETIHEIANEKQS